MNGLILMALSFGTMVASAQVVKGPARRVGIWAQDQLVPRKPHPTLRVARVSLVQPTGAEPIPPPSRLDITTSDEVTGEQRTYSVTPQMAFNRGFSLDGIRYRLLYDGYSVQINLRAGADGKLLDFTLDIDCDQRLSTRD